MNDFVKAYEYSNVPYCLRCQHHSEHRDMLCSVCGEKMVRFSALDFDALNQLDLSTVRELEALKEEIPTPFKSTKDNSCGCLIIMVVCILVFGYLTVEAIPWIIEGGLLEKWYGVLALFLIIVFWAVFIGYAISLGLRAEAPKNKMGDERYHKRLDEADSAIRQATTRKRNVVIGRSPSGEEMVFDRLDGIVRHQKPAD